jgi:hypothetical protein
MTPSHPYGCLHKHLLNYQTVMSCLEMSCVYCPSNYFLMSKCGVAGNPSRQEICPARYRFPGKLASELGNPSRPAYSRISVSGETDFLGNAAHSACLRKTQNGLCFGIEKCLHAAGNLLMGLNHDVFKHVPREHNCHIVPGFSFVLQPPTIPMYTYSTVKTKF